VTTAPGHLEQPGLRAAETTGDVEARAREVLQNEPLLLIGGRLTSASGNATFPSVSPCTEEVIAQVPDASPQDADDAVVRAVEAFDDWRATSVHERIECVLAAADLLEEHAEEFALLDAIDNGSPITWARKDAAAAVAAIRRLAGIAPELRGSTIPATGNLHMTVREPYGPVVRIVAYNHPFMFAATKIAAPVLAGNPVLIKPSELAPLSALHMGRILRDVFPAGVLSVLVGRDAALPRTLVTNPAVRRIGFIGSAAVGREIQRDAATSGVKNVTLELGGKNALIAFEDADPGEVARAAVEGMNFTWSGQSCMSTSRLLVPDNLADQVVAEIARIVEGRRIRSPFDPASEQGTIVSRAQYDRILSMIATAVDEGASLVTGGGRPAGLDNGLFIAPTVLDLVRPDHTVAQQEVFGPVLSIMRWSPNDDPVQIANSVEYGLTANVWTNDITRGLTTARALDVGYVWVNGWPRLFPGVPFGGVKNSGIGVEDGIEELESFTTAKAVNVIFNRGA
jgi:2-formylbenzoate dehydrogenase